MDNIDNMDNMDNMIDHKTQNALIEYVTDQHLDKISENNIRLFCSLQDKLTTTVYRGHRDSTTQTIRPSLWYSASKNISVAVKEFAGDDCCVFTIHLINVPCIDINKYIEKYIRSKATEEEVIFLGGGKFYKNEDLTEEGFKNLGNKNSKLNFETWYSIDTNISARTGVSAIANKKQIQEYQTSDESKENQTKQIQSNQDKLIRLANLIDKTEYEYIDGPDDIIIPRFDLNEAEKKQIFNIIQIKKQSVEMIGGKNTKRHRKTTKRYRKNTKRHRKTTKRHRKNTKRRRIQVRL